MDKKTYLQESVKNGRLIRWSFMPLKVYIAPMKFYTKRGQDSKYRALVKKALEEWHKVSNGKVSFVVVDKLNNSNIDIGDVLPLYLKKPQAQRQLEEKENLS